MLKHFDSLKDFGRFVFAKEYCLRETNEPFVYQKSFAEKIGDVFLIPTMRPRDLVLRNLNNPIFIMSMVILGIALTTIAFYPTQFALVASMVMPAMIKLSPATIKFGLYIFTNMTIIGLFLRTWCRLNPEGELVKNWEKGNLRAVAVGEELVDVTR